MLFQYFRPGFYLLAASLVLTSGAGASNTDSPVMESWRATVFEAWAGQDSEFKTSPTSPLAGVSRFEISEVDTVYFAEKNGEMGWTPEQGDQPEFSLVLADGAWKWTNLSADVTLLREDENISSGSLLQAGDVLTSGRFSVAVYPSETQVTALVFDADNQKIKDFNKLERFEANAAFAVTAKIEKFETPEKIEMLTGRQRYKQQFKYAVLKFEIDGVQLELTAYKYALEGEHSRLLFMPFTDKTTGKTSYGGGRYLMVDEPEVGNEVFIDFNLVTNPLCTYADIYNCIVPTLENKLSIAILAGEKKFH
jgi:uncharacterized protein (DUF1684 family)